VLDQHDEGTFSTVELPPQEGAPWDGARETGDTRAFYNRAFLPALSAYEAEHLFGWAWLGAAVQPGTGPLCALNVKGLSGLSEHDALGGERRVGGMGWGCGDADDNA
jgi:hypothetical protein